MPDVQYHPKRLGISFFHKNLTTRNALQSCVLRYPQHALDERVRDDNNVTHFTFIYGSFNDAINNSNNLEQNGTLTRTGEDLEAVVA